MKSKNNFYCPECFGNVSISDVIILKIKSNDNEVGLIMLATKVNDYHSQASDSIKMIEGRHYEFYCPLCSKYLNLEPTEKRLIKLIMKDSHNKKYEIIFSGVFGENCTYILQDYKLEYFGKHSKKYLDQIEKYKEFYDKHI